MKKKVFVGISGGVDSSVSAYLLKNQGFDVTGVFMKNWSGEDFGVSDLCPWKEDLEVAKDACRVLDIPILVYNFEKEYRESVISDFFYQYSIGNTPNPDVLCNKFIKFNAFLSRARNEGADYIATGHYAKTNEGKLFAAKDRNKDQTYFLHQLTPDQLNKSIFPLADLTKPEVRDIAVKAGLPNAKRKDSQGICFVGKIDVMEFLKNELKEKLGDIVDIDSGRVVGKHNGIWFYTVGQREGLGLGGYKEPYFVCKKDIEKNILYVASGHDNPQMFKHSVVLDSVNLISQIPSQMISVQIRYRGDFLKAQVEIKNGETVVKFIDPAWAVALGQSVVFYNQSECLGGGVVKSIID